MVLINQTSHFADAPILAGTSDFDTFNFLQIEYNKDFQHKGIMPRNILYITYY